MEARSRRRALARRASGGLLVPCEAKGKAAGYEPGTQVYRFRISSIMATARGSLDWLNTLTASLRTTALFVVRAS